MVDTIQSTTMDSFKGICDKLDKAIADHDNYEALQLMKSMLFRRAKKGMSKEVESKDGVVVDFENQEAVICDRYLRCLRTFRLSSIDDDCSNENRTCAVDLFKSFVSYCVSSCHNNAGQIRKINVEALDQSLHEFIDKLPSADLQECIDTFLEKSTNLQKKFNSVIFIVNSTNEDNQDAPDKVFDAYQLVASAFMSSANHKRAYYYLIRSNDVKMLSRYVYDRFSEAGYPSEFELFVALPTLQLLARNKVSMARLLFDTMLEFRQMSNTIDESPRSTRPNNRLSTSILNFIDMLILLSTNSLDNVNSFKMLAKSYKFAYVWDDALRHYVKLVGQKVFRVSEDQQDNAGSPNIFMNIVRSLINSTDLS